MHLKSQPWFVWRRLGECSCHPHLSSHSLRNLSPSLSQAATDSDTQPCWSLSEPSTCLAGSCADGERHFSQLRDTAVQSSSLGGSITVTWAGDPVTHTQDKIDRNVKVRIKLKVFFFLIFFINVSHIYLCFFVNKKKVFTIQPCRDQAQTCQQDYICRFLYLPVYSPGDAVCAAHAPTRSFAAQKKTRRRCTYHTVGDCESVPDAMYAIVMETFQVIV